MENYENKKHLNDGNEENSGEIRKENNDNIDDASHGNNISGHSEGAMDSGIDAPPDKEKDNSEKGRSQDSININRGESSDQNHGNDQVRPSSEEIPEKDLPVKDVSSTDAQKESSKKGIYEENIIEIQEQQIVNEKSASIPESDPKNDPPATESISENDSSSSEPVIKNDQKSSNETNEGNLSKSESIPESAPKNSQETDKIDPSASDSNTGSAPVNDPPVSESILENKLYEAKYKSNEEADETEEEKIDYVLLSKEDLVSVLEELVDNKNVSEIEGKINEVYEIFHKKREIDLEKKRSNFLASGGLDQDFKPVEDPLSKKVEDLMNNFRSLKSEHNKQLEKLKNENLAQKNEILEQFRILMESPESFDSTFRKFKQLQKQWFDIGIVPKQNVKDLWNSYNFFVDKFNDYVNINKELRQLDYKKNLDQKILLCEKAENLVNEKNIVSAFRKLQKFHNQWREIGPVPLKEKDELWQRFKEATSVINKSHQEYQSKLKESLVHNLEKKSLLCEKAEALSILDLDTHKKWSEKTNELLAIQKEWKTIGYAPKKVNNQIYSRFRKACDVFFDRKAEFYAKNFAEQNDNLEAKKEIVEEAEQLKDSKDWKETTEKLINLQKKWKNIGPVPRKDSDKLWKQFRAACDHFFTEKSNFFSGNDESHEENLKQKEELIQKIQNESSGNSVGSLKKRLEQYQDDYDNIGFVPINKKDTIRDEYRNALDDLVDRSELSEVEKMAFKYRIKILGLVHHSARAENKLNFERDKLITKLQQLQNDIGVWENNIGFFKETKSSEGTISDFQKKLDDAKERILILEKKIDIIDEIDRNL